MAKNKDGKHFKAEISGVGLHRIDGIVREVSDAGVTIDIKERGRRTMRATLIPMDELAAYTAPGAGFVVRHGATSLEPIAGKVTEETADEVVIEDANGVEIHFPLRGKVCASFVQVAEDDRSLNRSAVESKVARLAERESGSGGKKKSKGKKGSDDSSGSKKKKKKVGLRRKAK